MQLSEASTASLLQAMAVLARALAYPHFDPRLHIASAREALDEAEAKLVER